MAATSNAVTESSDRELVLTRIFDAPRSLVFKAWTEPRHLARWWGPRGFSVVSCEMDPRTGGSYRFHMRGPDGTDHWPQGVFREIDERAFDVMIDIHAKSFFKSIGDRG